MMKTIAALVFFCLFQLIVVGPAAAYIDPGTTGLVSQVLYVLFYGVLAACLYFFRSLISCVTALKEFLAKFFGRWLQR
jgi:hypothetical protein